MAERIAAPKASDVYVVISQRRLDENAPEPDIVARGVLSTPTDLETGVHGDHVKAVLAEGQNFRCDGTDATTDNCTQVHRHAEERILARLRNAETGRVGVAWRDMHPLIAEGVAMPGEPFRAEAKGLEIIVETRRVVEGPDADVGPRKWHGPDGEIPGDTITASQFHLFDDRLREQEERGKYREEIRNKSTIFLAEQGGVDIRIAAERERLLPLTANRATAEPMFDEVASAVEGIFARVGEQRLELLAQARINQDLVGEMREIIGSARSQIDEAMAPIGALATRLQQIARVKEIVVRMHADRDAFAQEYARTMQLLEATVAGLENHPNQERVRAAHLAAGEAIRGAFEGTDARAQEIITGVDAVLAQSIANEEAATAEIQGFEQRLNETIAGSNARSTQALVPLYELEDAIDRGLCKGWASVTPIRDAAGAISHWDVRFENKGDTPWIGTVVVCDANKNSGLGFESMGVPNRGSAAIQKVRADGLYGNVRPGVGTRIRLAVRGYASKELRLPENDAVQIPIRKFARMRADGHVENDFYIARDQVEGKRLEKSGIRYPDTREPKIRFFEGGRPWSP